jgi:stearoyl-CoA 9-desaturase NADPH oxidoreductase
MFSLPQTSGQAAQSWAHYSRGAIDVLDRLSARVTLDVPLLERALARVDPTLSLRCVRARVVSIVDETPDTKTYWLRTNARFAGHRSGEYVTVRVNIDGRQFERSYSISSAPRNDCLISITVKRVPSGRVSNWLADTLRLGDLLELSPARGQFKLPQTPPAQLLMLSAGSGITPLMSMLRQLAEAESTCKVTFLHFARTPRDIVFCGELERLAAGNPARRVICCVENAPESWKGWRGRISAELLDEVVPEYRTLDTFLCGPPGFMRSVVELFQAADADLAKLRFERFTTELDASMLLEHAQVLRFVRSGIERVTNRPRTILEEAENAGVPIASGCRAGNCGTCRSRKRRGVVVDINTGRASERGEEFIYPCVSVARGTVELEL